MLGVYTVGVDSASSFERLVVRVGRSDWGGGECFGYYPAADRAVLWQRGKEELWVSCAQALSYFCRWFVVEVVCKVLSHVCIAEWAPARLVGPHAYAFELLLARRPVTLTQNSCWQAPLVRSWMGKRQMAQRWALSLLPRPASPDPEAEALNELHSFR